MVANSLVSMDFIELVNKKSVEKLLMLKEKLLWVLWSPNDSIDLKVISAQIELISNRVAYLINSENDYLD